MRQRNFTKYDISFFIDKKGKTKLEESAEEIRRKRFKETHLETESLRLLEGARRRGTCTENHWHKSPNASNVLTNVPLYTVPKSRKKRLQEIKDKRDIYEFVDLQIHKKSRNYTKKPSV